MTVLVERFASDGIRARLAARLPPACTAVLACNEALDWRRDTTPAGGDAVTWRADVALPDLAADSILVPSLALLTREAYQFQFHLEAGGSRWSLNAMPGGAAPSPGDSAAVTTAVDCYMIAEPLQQPRLTVILQGVAALPEYLFSCSARPTTLDRPPVPDRDARCSIPPPPHSQMLADPAIARRICSPACLAMVLNHHGVQGADEPWPAVVQECFDPQTRLYGVWPLAIMSAARRDVPGTVEVLADWSLALRLLAAGLPFVASIRFAQGELPGSPLNGTAGHLVVVYGVEGDMVLVMDPAAETDATVARRYPAQAFAQAWLRHRGAAYILLP